MSHRRRAGYAALAVLALLSTALWARLELFRQVYSLPEFRHDDFAMHEFEVPTDDGKMLLTQVFTPDGQGPWPTIIVRNPYNFANSFHFFCKVFVRYGYACVH